MAAPGTVSPEFSLKRAKALAILIVVVNVVSLG
jgi:hypothetical protein